MYVDCRNNNFITRTSVAGEKCERADKKRAFPTFVAAAGVASVAFAVGHKRHIAVFMALDYPASPLISYI